MFYSTIMKIDSIDRLRDIRDALLVEQGINPTRNGEQAIRVVVDRIDDIIKIRAVAEHVICDELYVEVMYDYYLGKNTLIPITWFEDRDKHCEQWKFTAKSNYIKQVKDAIERSEQYVIKLKNALKRIGE